MALSPFEWKDKPALIEYLFPVQKISAESFKEQMAGAGKTLTALGSYWKGRKPLILNKACILGTLLPVTDDLLKDLEIFELLMGMDAVSMQSRLEANMPVSKRDQVGELLVLPFNEQVKKAKRAEEMGDSLFVHVWKQVNNHLGTSAFSFPELVEQIGIARFGHRPKVADVFCGSGQIPFEAARLGCDVYASDLNPIACMLTWGAFNVVGATEEQRKKIDATQNELTTWVQKKIDALGVETDENGWKAKAFLYCVEVICPETGWKVPLLPSFIISRGYKVIAKLIPDHSKKRYDINIDYVSTDAEVLKAQSGTVQDGFVVHSPDGSSVHRVNIKSIRGDFREGAENKNKLRPWEDSDFTFHNDDIYKERLYCVQWMKKKSGKATFKYKFCKVTEADLDREQKVVDYIQQHIAEWQLKGYLPDMLIELGEKTKEPIRTRGWTYWHHLFNPRQLLVTGLIRSRLDAESALDFGTYLNYNSKLCRWDSNPGPGRVGKAQGVFDNQALNTLFNYACRAYGWSSDFFKTDKYKKFPCNHNKKIQSHPAQDIEIQNDIYITDPPYGDAVKYEEITEFFIAWLRKNPPEEFSHWTWDSRRSLAIKGEDEGFRRGMIAAYRKTAEMMPDNGIQVLMFTHQSGAIWADMANIIWAAGLQVTAAWYVVTETDSALRQGANVKGTIILILRKRHKNLETFRDDLGWDIEEAVKEQVESLVGLDQSVRATGAEGLYTDADLQMAGYAAALKVLTAYSIIDGKDMVTEAEAPRVQGKKTFVDDLIEFAVQTAVQFLVPTGFEAGVWKSLQPVERFYLKMADVEFQGGKTLDNYQNFAKAFKVVHFDQVMSDASKANAARLKLSSEFKGSLISGDAEIAGTPLRAVLFGLYEINRDIDIEEVLAHLMEVCPNYMANKALLSTMADYLAQKRQSLKTTKNFRPDKEAEAARILAEAIRNHRL